MSSIKSPFVVLLIFMLMHVQGISQVVWTEPIFVSQDDDVTIYFNSKEGNGALAGYTGDVYAHAGLITDESNSPTDWQFVQGNWGSEDTKVLMTSLGDDLYSISYNIKDFYGFPDGEIVRKLAFVFRSADGGIVGRAEDGSDIYYDIYDENAGFAFLFISPSKKSTIVEKEDSVLIKIAFSEKTWVNIDDNATPIFQDSANTIEQWVFPSDFGSHTLVFQFKTHDFDTIIEKNYIYLDDEETLIDPPVSLKNGLNYIGENELIFSLTAPQKRHVFFLCPANDFAPDYEFKMHKSANEEFFWIQLPVDLFEDKQNIYQYLVDGNIQIADPFSELVLDPWRDHEIDPSIMANLPDYPEGQTSGIVTVFEPIDIQYNWTAIDYQKPEKESLVIYEILLRDFLEDHSFQSLKDTLDYLSRLGVNAIELMPVQEYEGNQSWGYNPSFHMALDKYYGSPEQFKDLIDACHNRGIAVILDVVYNHAFSQSPLCQLYWDQVKFRPSPQNPYLNEIEKHPFNVGYDFNHESEYTKAWVKQVTKYWLEEYKIDGFRFDLSKGFTQNNSNGDVGLWSAYDQSRINILKEYADAIWSNVDDAYIILEHFAENTEEKKLADHGMMLWGNVTHEYAEAVMGYSSGLSGTSYKDRGWNQPHLVSYMESHDEERAAYKLSQWGNSNASYDTKSDDNFADRIIGANLMYLSIPGPKMLWQFGELGYDFSINRCTDGTIDSNCRLSPKPIRWDYAEDPKRKIIYQKLAAILELKNNNPVFNTKVFNTKSDAYLKRTILQDADLDVVCIANFDVNARSGVPEFPHAGTWYDYLTGDIIVINDLEQEFTFEPGEYHIYLSKPITPSTGVFPSNKTEVPPLTVYPNPIYPGDHVKFTLENGELVNDVFLVNAAGRQIFLNYSQNGSTVSLQTTQNLAPGIYFIYIIKGESILSEKVMIIR